MAVFTINIEKEDNLPPVVTVGPDVSVPRTGNIGIDVDLTATATDPNGDVLTFLWEKLTPELTSSINNGNQLNAVANVLSSGVHRFRLTATDPDGLSDSGEMSITLGILPEINRQAFGDPGNNVVGQENPTFTVTTDETDGSFQTFQQFGGGTSGAQVSETKFLRMIPVSIPDPSMTFTYSGQNGDAGTTAVIEFDPPINYGQGNMIMNTSVTGTYVFKVEVETDKGFKDEQRFTVNVTQN